MENTPQNASRIWARAFALFTKNKRQWKASPLSDGAVRVFRRNCDDPGFPGILPDRWLEMMTVRLMGVGSCTEILVGYENEQKS